MTHIDHFGQDDEDACFVALHKVYAFLHGELPETEADLVRLHLDACEKCFEEYGIEQTITELVRRCNPPQVASASLRMRIVKMTISQRDDQAAS